MVLDIIFPKKCLICGRGGGYACLDCVEKFQKAEEICVYCGNYSFGGVVHKGCKHRNGIDGLVSLWRYQWGLRRVISAFKYRHSTEVFEDLWVGIEDRVRHLNLEKDCIFLPVPLARLRENWRGFNQSVLIADRLAVSAAGEFRGEFVVRKTGGASQVGMSREQRLRNIRGKYALNNEMLEDVDYKKRVYVVDDVWTTGATMKEVTKILKMSGFVEVWGFSLARG